MFKRTFAAAIVGALALATTASVASAQIDVKVSMNPSNKVIPTNNNGGGWGSTIVLDGAGTLPSFVTTSGGLPIVYCIDNSRYFSKNTYKMTMLTFSEFVAVSSTKPSPFNTITLGDLNAMATIAGSYSQSALDKVANTTRQENIWKISNGDVDPATLYPSVTFNDQSANWRVLVDRHDWNGKSGNLKDGVQTFLVQVQAPARVPEPASFALVGAGLVALAVASRRRQTLS